MKTKLLKHREIIPGSQVSYKNESFIVTQYLDINYAICKSIASGQLEKILIKDLQLPVKERMTSITNLTEKDWSEAQRRFQIIKPLIDGRVVRTLEAMKLRAQEFNVALSTIYRWINLYQESELISSLTSQSRGDKGGSRISDEALSIINFHIEKSYLTSQKPLLSKIINKIIMECKDKNIEPPHPNTIRNIVNRIPDEIRIKKRLGTQAANTYKPIEGHFPGANWPLSVVQIDHSKLDIILVDDVHRKPIGRPYLTTAIDVYSRVITGYYLSFDSPSSYSVGMCIANAISRKEALMIAHDIKGEWPVFGVMKTIHVDNGKDFRSESFKRSCAEYGIEILWRPVRVPHYGGNIERLFGTLENEIHSLPGSTFSSPKNRENYNSEKKSSMTISEFEKFLITYITGVYHQTEHSSINMPPIRKYEIGIIGDETTVGRGISFLTYDETKLKLDFMPFFERTIQAYGIKFASITYYSDILRRWINATDHNNAKLKRKFVFKYDPRNMSSVYFYDPEFKNYHKIPYRDISQPNLSIWDIRAIKSTLLANKIDINEYQIFSAYKQMETIVQESITQSKKARRIFQTKKEHKKNIPQFSNKDLQANIKKTESKLKETEEIKPFIDIIE